MGIISAPAYANIFLSKFEKRYMDIIIETFQYFTVTLQTIFFYGIEGSLN